MDFESHLLEKENFQGVSGVYYTSVAILYVTIIEYKHFEKQNITGITLVTKEFLRNTGEPFYPINDETNNTKFYKYKFLAKQQPSNIFGGETADYKYYDMHQIIASALTNSKQEISKNE